MDISIPNLNPVPEIPFVKKSDADSGGESAASVFKDLLEKSGKKDDNAKRDPEPDEAMASGEDRDPSVMKSVSSNRPLSTTTIGNDQVSNGHYMALISGADDGGVDQSLVNKVELTVPEKSVKSDKIRKPSQADTDDKREVSPGEGNDESDANGLKQMLDILSGSNVKVEPANDPSVHPGSNVFENIDTFAAALNVGSSPIATKTAKKADLGDSKAGERGAQPVTTAADLFAGLQVRTSAAGQPDKPDEVKLPVNDKVTDQSDGASAPQGKTENIVVLESRRYLALAPESNAFNLVYQIAGDKELSSALTSSIIDPAKSAATSKVVNTLKLQMTPHDLGTVTATLRLRGEELSVAITVQNSAAYNHLTSDQDKMVEALRAQGFAVDQVTVQLVSADRSASQDQQPQSSSQGQQQQEARNGASAQQGRQQGNGASQDNPANRNWQNFDTGGNPASTVATGPDERRDGQVYV